MLVALQWIVSIALAFIFCVMGVMHFVPGPRRTMAAMIPEPLRMRGALSPDRLVLLTGVCEILGGIGLVIPDLKLFAGLSLAVFLVAVFPANVVAARNPDRFGRLAIPLKRRLTGQIVIIALVLFAAWPLG